MTEEKKKNVSLDAEKGFFTIYSKGENMSQVFFSGIGGEQTRVRRE